MKRRHLLALAGVPAMGVLPGLARAQGYPTKPVRTVVPFSAATAADIVARQLAPGLGEALGQSVVIENIAGTAGTMGAATVARAAPDGYTLVMLGINNAINPSLYKEMPYDTMRDLKPVVRVAQAPLAIVANPSFPANSIRELIALAKSKPGQVFYGSGGSGSVTHLALVMLNAQAGIQLTHVPYKAISQMLTDIMGGQVPLGAPALASALGPAKAGKLKILAVTGATRSPAVPDVPTVAEAGFPDFDVNAWNGLVAPAGTPDDVVARLHAATLKVAKSREFDEAIGKQAMKVDLLGPDEFRRYIASELKKWETLVKLSGAKVD